ncbi:MAG: hypothetical protein HKN48_05275, partial [Flavobacteriaceae bacterium]|nr:hypothetical protein [Flavobacteriaceae bacterium]
MKKTLLTLMAALFISSISAQIINFDVLDSNTGFGKALIFNNSSIYSYSVSNDNSQSLNGSLLFEYVNAWTDPNEANIMTFSGVKVGLGVTNPLQKFHVKGKSYFDGNVGIGTSSPAEKLHVVGDAIITGFVGIGSNNPDSELTVKGKIHAEEVKVDLSVPADYVFQKYFTGASSLMSDYSMPTISEVEEFIKTNHHLPSIPSAKNIKEEGLHLGEMMNLLLQKIEELT